MTGTIAPRPGEQREFEWDCAPAPTRAPPGHLHAGEGLSDPSVGSAVVNLSGLTACGCIDLGDSYHGGRPYQCLHQWHDR